MPKMLGHYEIVSELGRGGMGVVYKAFEPSLDRHVAIKVLANQMADDPVVVQRFQREARSVAALNHPHIIQIFFIGKNEDQHYFVMEFVEGESLGGFIKRAHPIPTTQALKILRQTAQGLAAAHEIGVIHRDIKPANIMIDRHGNVKIADFGIALTPDLQKKLTATGQFLGTPGYLSPEVCLGEKADARTDIFSLGVVFFEMLTGKVPFQADSPLAMLSKVVNEAVPDVASFNADVEPEVSSILKKMVEKNRENRFQTCNELILALDEQLANQKTLQASHQAAMLAPTEAIPLPNKQEPPKPVEAPPPPPPPMPNPVVASPPPRDPVIAARPPLPQPKKTSWFIPVFLLLLLPALAVGGYFGWKHFNPSTDQNQVQIAGLEQDAQREGADPSQMSGDSHVNESETPNDGALETDEQPRDETESEPEGVALEAENTPERQTLSGNWEPQGSASEHLAERNAVETTDPAIESAHSKITVESQRFEPESKPDKERSSLGGSQKIKPIENLSNAPKPLDADKSREAATASIPSSSKVSTRQKTTPQVVVVVNGDQWVSDSVSQTLLTAFEGQSFETLDGNLEPTTAQWLGDRGTNIPGLTAALSKQGYDVLVVADVIFLGERQLQYMGRQSTAYKARLKVKALSLANKRSLGKGWQQEFEYTQLNASAKAEEAMSSFDYQVLEAIQKHFKQ